MTEIHRCPEILPPEQRLDDDLVQLCLELYARTFAYPDSKELHDAAFEAIKVLKDRLAYRRSFMSELNSAADVYRPAAPDDAKQAHSKSEFKRLSAMGVAVKAPDDGKGQRGEGVLIPLEQFIGGIESGRTLSLNREVIAGALKNVLAACRMRLGHLPQAPQELATGAALISDLRKLIAEWEAETDTELTPVGEMCKILGDEVEAILKRHQEGK
jgi:hypothetical protein